MGSGTPVTGPQLFLCETNGSNLFAKRVNQNERRWESASIKRSSRLRCQSTDSGLICKDTTLQKKLALLVPIGTRIEFGDCRRPMDNRREET